jgi:hypothetical protein
MKMALEFLKKVYEEYCKDCDLWKINNGEDLHMKGRSVCITRCKHGNDAFYWMIHFTKIFKGEELFPK